MQEQQNSDGLLTRIGPLRAILGGFVLLCLPVAFISGGDSAGWRIAPDQIVPALVALLVWSLPFDILMARLWMGEYQGAAQARYRTIMRFDTALIAALLVFWGPFFVRLLTP